MRILFALIFLAGLGAAFIYPWSVQNFSGDELGSYRVFERAGGFRPVDVPLRAEDAPVRVLVDLSSTLQPAARNSETILTITASTGGRTVLAETLGFIEAGQGRDPEVSGERIYRDDAGIIGEVETGTYRFVVGPGDADQIPISQVDLVLRSGAGVWDRRAQPLGFVLMAVGVIGFVLSFRAGGGTPSNPNSQPPAPRWGRGGGGPPEG